MKEAVSQNLYFNWVPPLEGRPATYGALEFLKTTPSTICCFSKAKIIDLRTGVIEVSTSLMLG